MGIISRHGLRVLVLLLPYLILATASDDHRWRGKYDESQNTEWKNNKWNIPDKENELRCCIQACMIGPFCNESVANYTPQFKSGYTFAEITKDGIGQRVEYNSTTYPTPNGCVCDNIVYTLVSVYNDIEHETENGVFAVDRYTGEITLQKEMGHTEMYSLLVEARNVRTNISTETKLTVARRFTPKSNWMEAFEPIQQMGYEEPHHRQKRSTPGDQINFALTKLDNINSTKVGHKVDFQLVIDFPPSAVIDMLIEIFAPDNDTTVMILCDVSFSHDPQITTSNNPAQIQMDSKDGNNVTLPDRAIIDFGDVTNTDGANTRQITVLYSAVMVKNTATIDAATYWVSIGADFDNENYLWVGQASFTADYDTTAAVQPLFFVDAPNDVESGSSHNIAVQMQLPYPHSTYNFRVYAPADAPGTMSVCSVQYQGHGTNYGCGNDFTAVSTTLTADPTGPGNSVGLVSLGQLLNAGSRDANPLTDASNISLSFIAHVYPSLSAGSLASLALSLEVDTNILWVGNLSMNVLTKTATPVSPTITSTNVDFFGGAAGTVGQPFSITYNIDVPIPSVPGAGYNYVLQVLAPFTTKALFSVCSLEIVSVGQDLPCIKTDDLVPVYTSRDPSGTLPDTATLDLGSVTNVNLHTDGVLVVKATLSPIEGKVTAPTSETVYFGATVDSTYIALHNESINIQNSATSIVVTNATAPTFNMDYWDNATDVRINGVTRLDIDMMTGSNTTYQPLELEFLMPTDGSRSYMHICKVEVSSRGRNLPCLTPEWSNKIMEYISTYSNDEYDRARLSLQRLCNTAEFVDTEENRAVFSVYLKVLDLDSLVDNTQKWVSAGLIYSTTKLWIGQIDMLTRTAAGLAIPQPSQYVHTHFQQNSTAGAIQIGESAQYSLLVKLPKNETVDLKIQVNSSAQGLDICTVRVFASGDNVPCTEDELTTKSYTYHADDGRASAFLDVGVIKKFTLDDTSINNFFDMDSLIIEVIVTGSVAGSYTFDLEIFLDTAMNTANSIKYSNYNVTVLSSTQTQTYADVVNMTIAVGEFVTNDTVDSNWAIGEVKRMLLDAYIPENYNYQLDFSVIIPSSYVGKLEVLDAALFSVGSNLPCIDLEKTVAVITGTGTYNDTAQFNLGHICSWPLKPGVATENRIVFEVFIRALPNGAVAAGETVEIDGTMTVNGGSPISVTSTTLTITSMDSFVDKVQSYDGVTNSTVIELDQANPISMTISQNLTIGVLITITPNSQSRFLFDVQTPLSDSACLTIWDMRVIGTQGRNVLDIGPSVSKGLEFTPQYNSTLGNGQQDYGFIDLGIVSNTGLTHRLKSNATDDDKFKIEVDVQMADCAASAHAATLMLSFGEKLLNVIIVYDHPVQISRDNQEKPDIVFDVLQTVISSNLYIDAVVYHSNTSTAETYNMSVLAYLPSYQVAPASLAANNLADKCSLVSTDSLVVEISCTTFFFNDTLTFRAIAGVNNSVELAQGYSSSDSGTFYEITADFNYRSDYYNTTDPQDWFPTYTSSPNSLAYSVSAGIGTGCVSALGMEASGAIQDCQISGSLNGLTDILLARLNALGGAWRPFIRAGEISKMRYIQVYFGNIVKVTQIAVQQNGNAIATSIAVEHSHDGIAWYGREEINLAGAALETVSVPGGESAEYIRVYVGNTTVPAHPDVSLRFELYGCTISGTMSQADICSSAPTSPSVPSDFYPRSFLVDPSGQIIVCDRALSSDYTGRCQTSPDGNSWQAVAENVATVIGLEATKMYIYAYAQDLETILRSEDGAITWLAVESDQLTTDKNGGSWQDAKEVLETLDGNLVQGTPHNAYTQGNWGATYDGIFLSGVERLKWTST